MKKLAAMTLGITTLAMTGCAGVTGSSPPSGFFYTGVKGVHPATEAEVTDGVRPGPKSGKSCASGVLGLAAWGDMSLDAAKKSAGITRVDTLDFSSMAILGAVYVKNCTLVTGE